MPDTRYDVVFRGEILENFDLVQVKKNFARLFALSEERVEKIFATKRTAIKLNVDRVTAEKYQKILAKAGASAKVESHRQSRASGATNKVDDLIRQPPVKRVASAIPARPKPARGNGAPEQPGPAQAGLPSNKEAAAPGRKPERRLSDPARPAPRAPEHDTGVVPEEGKVVAKEKHPSPPTLSDEVLEDQEQEALSLRFTGSGLEYFNIWIVNTLLTIATFGIYSAWAKVRSKQYFYSHTELEGTPFEYLANPLNILKGRALVVICMVLGISLGNLHPLLALGVGLLLLVFLPWIIVHTLTFNARNSAYRNVRFDFQAPLQEAARVFVGWPLLAVVSAGVLAPRAYFQQQRFLIDHYSYGSERFTFTVPARAFDSLFAAAAGMAAIGSGLVFLLGKFSIPLMIAMGIILYLYVFAFFTVRRTNLIYKATRLGPHRLRASLDMNAYSTLIMTNTLAIVLTLGLFTPWARVAAVKYRVKNIRVLIAGELDKLIADEQERAGARCEQAPQARELDIGL